MRRTTLRMAGDTGLAPALYRLRSARRGLTIIGPGVLAAMLLLGGSCTHSTGPSVDPWDIGDNLPDIAVAFGDSISYGRGSTDELGYRRKLEELFLDQGRFLHVLNEGIPGSVSSSGARRIGGVLEADKPAVVIILYGTNDQYLGLPQPLFQAYLATTSENLESMIETARRNKTLAVVSTLPPVCGREQQLMNTISMNDKIRRLVEHYHETDPGVLLADAYAGFIARDPVNNGCDFIDSTGVHPNDDGYSILAEVYHDVLKNLAWH